MDHNLSYYIFILFCFCFGYVGNIDAKTNSSVREAVLNSAYSDLGIEEKTGKNDGPVNKYQTPYGAKNLPYCAFFVKFNMDINGVNTKGIDGRAVSVIRKDKVINPNKIKPADQFYVHTKIGTGHTGYVYKVYSKKDRFISIEGNYQNKVSSVTRKISKTKFADWIGEQKTTNPSTIKPPTKLKEDKSKTTGNVLKILVGVILILTITQILKKQK
jgi:hypothetical protein